MALQKTLKAWILLSPLSVLACAGPTTPLGAVGAWKLSEIRNQLASETLPSPSQKQGPKIRFTPSRQVLHGPKTLTILVEDPAGIPPEYQLKIVYNHLDVTQAFLGQAKISKDREGRNLEVKVRSVRLFSLRDHQIEVSYSAENGVRKAFARYEPPTCHAFGDTAISNTDLFEPSFELLMKIAKISMESGFSPSFTAALIAQESGFNPRTVSWARGIGLTQVTPVAEDEISKTYSNWPKYPGLNAMPILWVKMMVMAEEVNAKNEWRLDMDRSIQGGLAFASTLLKRWNEPEGMSWIAKMDEPTDLSRTKLLLASYHSGYSRVMSALRKHGKHWIRAPELRAARSYVNRILSYCSCFSEPEEVIQNERET